ncbi:MAG TPA: beta-ketoacyl synthase N-terminal-like domain-containing protein, partial [Phycisphaerales bacterium]|nr:beta-ketoacyl synthase N-terminal-like domain-containing protein [Phycisphaerales bacterium]
MSRRVVITGLGPVTAFGVGIEPLWKALLDGRSAIAPITRFNASGFPCSLGAELPEDKFNIRDVVPKSYRKATKVMCRDIELAVAAAAAAISDAGLVTRAAEDAGTVTVPPHRMGCHIGAGLIAADVDELTAALATSRKTVASGQLSAVGAKTDSGSVADEPWAMDEVDLAEWGRAGMENLTPLWLLKYLPNMLACHVTIIHDCQGPSNTITCCEASSGLSLGESVRVIARDRADACLTGGAEFKLNPMAFYRQHAAGRLAPTSDEAARAVKPFDPSANGTVLGEGGGILIVEEREHALARGAKMYAEVAGFASTQSICRNNLTFDFDPEDHGISDAMENAIAQAGITPAQIDAIAPFGSGIPNVDQAEAAAIRRVFGARA